MENKTRRRNIPKPEINTEEIISKEMNEALHTNFAKRTLFTVLMIGLFIFISSCNVICLISLVIILGILILKEVVDISKTNQGYPSSVYIIFGFSSIIYIYFLSDALAFEYPAIVKGLKMFRQVYFYAYLFILILFVCSLKAGKLKKQFSLFSLIHLTSYLVGICCRSAIRNINIGKFWLFFPSTLVICNDIFAYIVGKSIGSTPLFRLSPKKTVEGFIGGFVFTAIYGFLFCYAHFKYCILTDTYINELRELIYFNVFNWSVGIPCIYIHCSLFVLVASFVAPFSGFFASAFKRAYNKKDFGNSIPGHGGITDRFDCQCIVVVFTTVYLKSFLKTKEQSLASTFYHIINLFKREEIEVLTDMLQNYLRNE